MSPGTRRLTLVWLALLGLLASTLGSAFLPLGPLNLPLNLGFSSAKALLVAIVFMQLNRAGSAVRIIACAGVLWLFVLVGLGLAAYLF
jgi:cytochrome c oxidase subunit 4